MCPFPEELFSAHWLPTIPENSRSLLGPEHAHPVQPGEQWDLQPHHQHHLQLTGLQERWVQRQFHYSLRGRPMGLSLAFEKSIFISLLQCPFCTFGCTAALGKIYYKLHTLVQTASPNLFFVIYRWYPHWFFKVWTAKKKHIKSNLQKHLEVVWNAIPIRFLQKRLCPEALVAQIGFRSVFCITRNMAHNNDVKLTWLINCFCSLWVHCGGVSTWLHGEQQIGIDAQINCQRYHSNPCRLVGDVWTHKSNLITCT